MQHEAYIYILQCLPTSKIYVGSSRRLSTRKNDHFRKLNKGQHVNAHLQSAYTKYGKENFKFSILENCLEVERDKREQFWIDKLKAANSECGFNLQAIVGKVGAFKGTRAKSKLKGRKFLRKGGDLGHSDETKRLLSNQHKHKFLSEDIVLAILDQYREGCTVASLAKFYNLSHSYTSKIVHKRPLYVREFLNKIEMKLGREPQ